MLTRGALATTYDSPFQPPAISKLRQLEANVLVSLLQVLIAKFHTQVFIILLLTLPLRSGPGRALAG